MKKKILSKEQISSSLLNDCILPTNNVPFITTTRNKNKYEHTSKLFSFSNAKTANSNTCPGNDACPNTNVIKQLKYKIRKLQKINMQLTEMNNYLINVLSHKDSVYQRLLNDNVKMKSHMTLFPTEHKRKQDEYIDVSSPRKGGITSSLSPRPSSKTEMLKNKKRKIILKHELSQNANPIHKDLFMKNADFDNYDDYSNYNSKTKRSCSLNISIDNNNNNTCHKNNSAYPTHRPCNSINTNNNHNIYYNTTSNSNHKTHLSNNILSYQHNKKTSSIPHLFTDNPSSITPPPYYIDPTLTHYDKISILSRQTHPSFSSSSNISFLSATPVQLNQLSSNPILTELNILSQFEETFVSNICAIPKDNLYLYCETLKSLTTEYKSLIKLITRVKAFLQSSINLVDSVLLADSTTVLINNTCTILNCERTSLFIYDKFTDSLVIGSAEGLKKNSIKVPKDKGIVGYVFTKGQKVKIDDAYKDPRFNKEIDKKTNFKTRNILCYPLKDKDGDTFGAIQAINKQNGPFDIDDLALMDIFSQQASAILQNRLNMDENVSLVSKIQMICQFGNEVMGMKNKVQFTKKGEECLQFLFYSSANRVMFVDNENKVLEHYVEEDDCDNKQIIKLLGIVGYVWKKKEMHGCVSVKKCKYYNNLVDLNSSDYLVTVPIVNDDTEVIAIIQSVIPGNLNEKTGKIVNTEMILLDLFGKSVLAWYKANFVR